MMLLSVRIGIHRKFSAGHASYCLSCSLPGFHGHSTYISSIFVLQVKFHHTIRNRRQRWKTFLTLARYRAVNVPSKTSKHILLKRTNYRLRKYSFYLQIKVSSPNNNGV